MNALLTSITRTHAGYGISLLRIVTGLTFAAHGSQKLFGWFGGYGLAGVAQWMESIGITPGYLMAALAGSAEFFGGLALVVGLLVRPAAVSLLIAMLVAIISVQPSVSKACVRSAILQLVLTWLRWRLFAYQVQPTSTRPMSGTMS